MRVLDVDKTKKYSTHVVVLNMVLPSLLIIIGGVLFNIIRKRKYSK
mgnify:FL=1